MDLDPQVAETIVSLLRESNFLETAASVAGVDPRLVRRWLAQGGKDERAGKRTRFVDFRQSCARAKAMSEAHDMRRWNAAGDTDWRSILARRERIDPERFGPPRERVEYSGQLAIKREIIGATPEDL